MTETEQEWLTSADWLGLWIYSASIGRLSDRKKQLFAVATCRRIVHRLVDPRTFRGLEVTERFADGEVDEAEWENAFAAVERASDECYFHQRPELVQSATRAVFWSCSGDMDKISRGAAHAADIDGYDAAIAAGVLTEGALTDA